MCFSCEIDNNIKKLSKRFQAQVSAEAYLHFKSLLAIQNEENGPQKIKQIFNRKRISKQFIQEAGENNRIYPNYFAPVIVMENNQRVVRPMRYRVRPHSSKEEIPTKYNLFNARLDSLETKATWKPIFMRNHGLFPFKTFFEWIEDEKGKKTLIKFIPKDREITWAPCIYDTWESDDHQVRIQTFAIITDDPPPEIAQMGHDRCPIFILEKNIDIWLSPESSSKKMIYQILKEKEAVYYDHQWSA